MAKDENDKKKRDRERKGPGEKAMPTWGIVLVIGSLLSG